MQTKVKPMLLDDFLELSEFEPNYLCTFYILSLEGVKSIGNGKPLEKIYLARGRDEYISYTAQCFPIDIDSDDLNDALEKLKHILHLLQEMGVDINLIYLFFSGKKGFHIFIPSQHFGGFIPKVKFQNTFYDIHDNFDFPSGYTDRSIYSKRRGMKVPNTQHPATNLYKIQLTLSDIDLGIEHIKKLAKNPRKTWEIDTSLIEENDNLISLKQPHVSKEEKDAVRGQSVAQNKAVKRIKKVKKLKKGKPLHQRTTGLVELITTLREQGHDDYHYILDESVEYIMNSPHDYSYQKIKDTILSLNGYKWDYIDNPLRQNLCEGNVYLNEHCRTFKSKAIYQYLCLNANMQGNYYRGEWIDVNEIVSGKFKIPELINRGLLCDKKDGKLVNGISPEDYRVAVKKFTKDKAIDVRVVKSGNKPLFSIISHNFFDIRNYVKIKGTINEE